MKYQLIKTQRPIFLVIWIGLAIWITWQDKNIFFLCLMAAFFFGDYLKTKYSWPQDSARLVKLWLLAWLSTATIYFIVNCAVFPHANMSPMFSTHNLMLHRILDAIFRTALATCVIPIEFGFQQREQTKKQLQQR